jgi:hypothetical protein
MQARAYPAHLPGSGPLPGVVGTSRGGLFPCGSLGRRAPAGRGGATSVVCAVDGASVAAAASAVADSPLPPAQVTWQIVVGAVGRPVLPVPSLECVAYCPFHELNCLTASALAYRSCSWSDAFRRCRGRVRQKNRECARPVVSRSLAHCFLFLIMFALELKGLSLATKRQKMPLCTIPIHFDSRSP